MFDLAALRSAVAAHGRVARVVVAACAGSVPREAGAEMLVWDTGQSGTIGGGALEWEAVTQARAMLAGARAAETAVRLAPPLWRRDGARGPTGNTGLAPGAPDPLPTGGRMGDRHMSARQEDLPDNTAPRPRVERLALGPALQQCCGGAVTLWTEVFHQGNLPAPQAGLVIGSPSGAAMPLAVARMIDRARAQGTRPAGPVMVQGWLVEPVAQPARHLWLWGAGHVGRAIAAVLAPLPGLALTWVDVARDRFPEAIPEGVTVVPVPDPALAVLGAPKDAEHLILTFSHALDLALCHALLTHGFARAGLIASATKWARFRSRLAALGHAPAAIARIDCPIGDPALGKHPQAIAIGVASAFLAAPKLRSAQENAG